MRRRTLLAGALLALAGPAEADPLDWPEMKAARLGAQTPEVAFAAYGPDGAIEGVSVYAEVVVTADATSASALRGPPQTVTLVARRVSGRGAVAQVSWTEAARCAALDEAMSKLSSLPTPRIDAPRSGLLPPPVGQTALDGATYMVWARAARWDRASAPLDPHATQIELRGEYDTPHARWVRDTLKALAPCWRPGPAAE